MGKVIFRAEEKQIVDRERVYTNAEFEALPTDGKLLELIEGKVVEKMPGDRHGRIARRLNNMIYDLDPAENLGIVWLSTSCDLGEGWIPIPDLVFISAVKVPEVSDGSIKAIPDLVVEVHSPSDLDTKPGRDAAENKIKKYLSKGVSLIWAINPRTQEIEIYRQGSQNPVKTLTINDTLSGEEIIPNFAVAVSALFA